MKRIDGIYHAHESNAEVNNKDSIELGKALIVDSISEALKDGMILKLNIVDAE